MRIVSFVLLSLFAGHVTLASTPFVKQVSEAVYRGPRPAQNDIQLLRAIGIKTMIDLQGGDLNHPEIAPIIAFLEPGETSKMIAAERRWSHDVGLDFYNFPLDSIHGIPKGMDQTINGILALLADPQRAPFFIHCEHGVDRTGLVVALYRVLFQHWSASAAHDEWVRLGHSPTHELFNDDLDLYFYEKVSTLQP